MGCSALFQKFGLCVLPLGLVACAFFNVHEERSSELIPSNRCANPHEDYDGFQDQDGCLDPDNDGDGIADSLDQCPLEAEDLDGFADTDGCPDNDNDRDGIEDSKDRCPNQAEDTPTASDADGCPEYDQDEDSVVDSLDQCPQEAEDPDEFEDQDGCPEWDNDGDGILDHFDRCPDDPENINGLADEDGCPDQKVAPLSKETQIVLLFDPQTDDLTPSDRQILQERLVSSLVSYPEHRIYVYYFMPQKSLDIMTYLDKLNQRTRNIRKFLLSRGVGNAQVRVRVVTQELFHSQQESTMDFDQKRPALFIRK